ncbi:solute carrier family 25 member 45-like [Planococcus citri]|uniref:solute carrier family 25 member 45-like n=1 Tax=Planococcus citri TaxID=170843 RepID=UPI0031F757A7
MIDIEFLSWKDFTAGWVSGICSTAVGYPMETIKVRQQMTPNFGSAFNQAVKMVKREGMPCFFKGLSYPLWTTGVLNSLYFGFYGNSLRMIEEMKGQSHHRNCCEYGTIYKGWHFDCFVAGCIGGTVATLVNTPIELVKTILQADSSVTKINTKKLTPNACLKKLFKTNGVRGCYHGGLILLYRDVPTYGLYAVIYEHIACMLKTRDRSKDRFTHILYEGVAGGLSGVITWILAYPVDVIKSRFMSDCYNKNRRYSGITDCIVKTYKQYGIRAYYKGIWIAIVRAFPVNLICFVTYEQTLRLCAYF